MPVTRIYGGVSGDDRLSDRRARLMAAGLNRLVSDEGPRAFSVRGVCREAELSSRYFYDAFENADELAAAIYDEEIFSLMTVTLAAIQEAGEGDVARLASIGLRALIGHVAEDPRRGRLFFSPALEAVPAIEERRVASRRLFVGLTTDEMQNRLGVKPGKTLDVAVEILIGGLAQAADEWLSHGLEMSQDDFVDACAELFTAVGELFTHR